jgi:hypothetical protein
MNTENDNSAADTGVRMVERTTPLHAGVIVYRVVEIDPPPDVDERHCWKVAAATVERGSVKQIKLRAPFPGLTRTVFDPSAFGRAFFETPLQAIRAFLAERRLEIEAIDRRRKDVERAIAWATSQEGV